MSHSPEHMRQKTEARMKAEYHHAHASVDGMRVAKMANEKPDPSNSVAPSMGHNRTGLGLRQEDENG